MHFGHTEFSLCQKVLTTNSLSLRPEKPGRNEDTTCELTKFNWSPILPLAARFHQSRNSDVLPHKETNFFCKVTRLSHDDRCPKPSAQMWLCVLRWARVVLLNSHNHTSRCVAEGCGDRTRGGFCSSFWKCFLFSWKWNKKTQGFAWRTIFPTFRTDPRENGEHGDFNGQLYEEENSRTVSAAQCKTVESPWCKVQEDTKSTKLP